MTQLRTTLALLLVILPLVLTAACTDQSQIMLSGKYVYFIHAVDEQWVTVSGSCPPNIFKQMPLNFFDARTGQLIVHQCSFLPDAIGPAFMMYSMNDDTREGAGTAIPVLFLPRSFEDGVTITDITSNGTVTLEYRNQIITLNPGESMVVNKTTKSHARYGDSCSLDIVITDSFTNAGIYEKRDITVTPLQCSLPGLP